MFSKFTDSQLRILHESLRQHSLELSKKVMETSYIHIEGLKTELYQTNVMYAQIAEEKRRRAVQRSL